jgi:hypothetical protein
LSYVVERTRLPRVELTHDILRATIEEVRRRWIDEGVVPDVRTIGQGLCYEFAEEIMRILGRAEDYGNFKGDLIDKCSDDWWCRVLEEDGSDAGEAEFCVMDIPRLRAEGAPLPDDIGDDDLANILGGSTHQWLEWQGRAYDAAAPEGVDHFLMLPLFVNNIQVFRDDPSGWYAPEQASEAIA